MPKQTTWNRLFSIAMFFTLALSPGDGRGEEIVRYAEFPTYALRARWSEDWSLTNDPDRAIENIRFPLKHVKLNKKGTNYLSLGGEYRLAYESYDKADRGVSDTGCQNVWQNRLALHADWQLSQQWRLFGQLGYAAVHDRDGGAQAVDETDVDVWQLFVDYAVVSASTIFITFFAISIPFSVSVALIVLPSFFSDTSSSCFRVLRDL